MNIVITSEILQAYSLCSRKAYLLMYGKDTGEIHEYEKILERRQFENHTKNLELLKHKYNDVYPYSTEALKKKHEFLVDANLSTEKLQAYCPILTRKDNLNYVPTIFLGTYKIRNIDKLKLIFIGHILAEIQEKAPQIGYIINVKGESRRLNLEKAHKFLVPLLHPLQEWLSPSSVKEAPVILNKHCPICQFRKKCREIAIEENNLSLLDKVTPKIIRQYEKKGIFTVEQISYLFKPSKRKKTVKKSAAIKHDLKLQALAIRTSKIYLQAMPSLAKCETEFYLDIEGLPDQNSYYLIGLLVCQKNTTQHYSFWANSNNSNDERKIWTDFLETIDTYDNDIPIYHYGSYELRAIKTLSKRYKTFSQSLISRLINVNQEIYGKIYFPIYSNRLKEIGNFVGARWTSSDASGVQSLVWRYYWDANQSEEYKIKLLTYNKEDCYALKLIVDKIDKIKESARDLSEIDFANHPKTYITEIGDKVHKEFESILKFSISRYEDRKISFKSILSKKKCVPEANNKPGAKKGYQGQRKIRPKPFKVVQVLPEEFCPKCLDRSVKTTKKIAKRLIIDLVLTKSGIKKTITEYVGKQSYCGKCNRLYSPPGIRKFGRTQLYGHGVKSWFVYHRVALRLPYEQAANSFHEQFQEPISWEYTPAFIKNLSQYYEVTEKSIENHLLGSQLIHADETPINIRGATYYVWVFTNKNHVIFRLAETREAALVHEFLKDFNGILISDFYGGYDSINCRQQKCWVHLIRDLK